MSTDTNTGAQAPATPVSENFLKKNWMAIALAVLVLVVAVLSTLVISWSSNKSAPVAAALPTTSEAPASVAINETVPTTTVAPAPVAVAPSTTSAPATLSNTVPTSKTDYVGWVQYLEKIYSRALATGDTSNLASQYFVREGAQYTAEFGMNSGVPQDAMKVALYRATGGNIPPVVITDISVFFADPDHGNLVMDFTSTYGNFPPGKYENTYTYEGGSWKVIFQKQFS
jgi:hypothetical protein